MSVLACSMLLPACGNPDETTDFDNAKFEIDYVRVYQKDGTEAAE